MGSVRPPGPREGMTSAANGPSGSGVESNRMSERGKTASQAGEQGGSTDADRPFVEYIVSFEDGKTYRHRVDLGRGASGPAARDELPAWTALGYQQCTNCPLTPAESPRCPAAVDTFEILQAFRETISYERCEVHVLTPAREYVKSCDVQTMLKSLLGLVMAAGGCPILSRLRGMAENHLPFASARETVYRTTADYLLQQYLSYRHAGPVDMELAGLRELYAELEEVNRCFVRRIRAAMEKDASPNALVKLFTMAAQVHHSLDQNLAELEPLFAR